MRPRALVLDRTHHVLLARLDGASFELLRAEPRRDERAMRAIERVARERLGLTLEAPCGARPLLGTPFELIYLVDRAAVTPMGDIKWVPLRTLERHAPDDADAAWQLYTDAMLGGFQPPRRELDVFSFGDGAEEAARLAHLVIKGTKRATTAWVEAARARDDGDALPVVGMTRIVTDGFGLPLCAIRTEHVEQLRFGDVGADMARAEGEGDRTLDEWRDVHRRFFAREGAARGLTFTDDAIVCFERFRLVRVLARGA